MEFELRWIKVPLSDEIPNEAIRVEGTIVDSFRVLQVRCRNVVRGIDVLGAEVVWGEWANVPLVLS